MRLIRTVTALIAFLVVGGGYLASQSSFLSGQSAEYTQRIESSPLPLLSLVLFLAIIILAFLPAKEEDCL
jgi:uncharacterized membrane protein YdjX (TVP38/TMEM64 family)